MRNLPGQTVSLTRRWGQKKVSGGRLHLGGQWPTIQSLRDYGERCNKYV